MLESLAIEGIGGGIENSEEEKGNDGVPICMSCGGATFETICSDINGGAC